MRKIIVNEHISLDGVIQGPGGPGEDTSGGFELGGWSATYADETTGQTVVEAIQEPYDLLLGRFTFEIWENYWPFQSGEIADQFNSIKKYVGSKTRNDSNWSGIEFLNDDIVEQIKNLKASNGPNLHVWGSSNFLQSLLKNGLIDQLNLWVYPVVLGKGKKLFEGEAFPGGFKLAKHAVASTGVIFASYTADGEVKTGQVGEE